MRKLRDEISGGGLTGPLELWGGVECTLGRIGDTFRDQLVETGHRDRLEDLDRIASLGIRTLRYPVLWEAVSPNHPDETDFTWHDERLRRLEALNIEPIIGLCHHGSGPRYTRLTDPAWPELLARHAARVAERYPAVRLYTPVNEPLTTARFAGLYGHWYPHGKSYGVFLPALVNQCKATVLAMRAVRAVRADARLVQTEDIGKTFSTPGLAGQTQHENERRWLTFDLLCGRIVRDHPWWRVLCDAGVREADLHLFLEADAAPDIVGVNHYLTSERFLDERVERYPDNFHGGNGRQIYADVEAVRVRVPLGGLGPAARLREVWQRYRRPIAITEAHNGCTREEQLRWLVEVWKSAEEVRHEGADVRAVTAWSLFGAVDWNSLLVREERAYEAGVFDARGPTPRPTALAAAAEFLARTGTYNHPVLEGRGWWKREDRFLEPLRTPSVDRRSREVRPILVVGGGRNCSLATAIHRTCESRGLTCVFASHESGSSLAEVTARVTLATNPWAVIVTRATGSERVADVTRTAGLPLVIVSSSRVFAGSLGRPYLESDEPDAADRKGLDLALAERRSLAANPTALILRSGPLFGPWDDRSFAGAALGRQDARVTVSREIVSPTYLPDFAHEALNLLIDGVQGIWHLSHSDPLPWSEIHRQLTKLAGRDASWLECEPCRPPKNTALQSERGTLMPPLTSALERFVRDAPPALIGPPLLYAAE